MNQDIIKKLNTLNSIKPDSQWKEDNRSVLLSQIANTNINEENITLSISTLSQKFMRLVSQPAWAMFFIVLLVGSIFSVRAAQDTKPGDSLYIAKIISKKAQLAVTFGKEEKNKLSAKHANGYAKAITQVLSEDDFDNQEGKAEKLEQDFKNEIKTVRYRLQEIKNNNENKLEESEEIAPEDLQVFSANLKKDDKGMQVSGEDVQEVVEEVMPEEPVNSSEVVTTEDNNEASTTEELELNIEEVEEGAAIHINNANQILEEAEALFDSKNYNGTLSKLEEIDMIIESANDTGEVQGTSTNVSL